MSATLMSIGQSLEAAEQGLRLQLIGAEQSLESVFENDFAAADGSQGDAFPKPTMPTPSTAGGADQASGPAATSAAGEPDTDLSSEDTQNLLNGDYYTGKPLDVTKATCPPNVSMDKLMDASGGLLKNAGDQQFKGSGAAGIQGGYLSNLAKIAGGSVSDIGAKNPTQHQKDVTMRVEMMLQSCKNAPGENGTVLPASVRHNGNLSGLQPSKEVCPGSDLAMVQDMIKGHNAGQDYTIPDKRPKDAHMNGNDGERSGIGVWWNEWGEKAVLGVLAVPLALVAPEADIGLIGGEVAADAIADGTADGVASAASAAGRAASAAGRTAGEAGSTAGRSAVQDYMKQLALQTAKEGGKEGVKQAGQQIEGQLQPPVSSGSGQTATPYVPVTASAATFSDAQVANLKGLFQQNFGRLIV